MSIKNAEQIIMLAARGNLEPMRCSHLLQRDQFPGKLVLGWENLGAGSTVRKWLL